MIKGEVVTLKKVLLLGCALFLLLHVTNAHAAELENSLSLKVTVIENGIEYQWEYTNPDEYEYEHGNTIVKGDEGRRLVTKMFRYLNISPEATVKKMVAKLKRDGHKQIQRLDVRWIDNNEKLYTWVWNKKDH
jgi:hypothetical protein